MNNLLKNVENVDQFAEVIKEKLTVYYLGSREIMINKVNKNNGIILTGITVKSDVSNLSPTIYMETFFENYKNGEPVENIVSYIAEIISTNEKTVDFDVELFLNFENVKKRLVYKLVNKEKNESLLKDIPYIEFLDMVIVFYYILDSAGAENATILIKNEHMEKWGRTKDDLLAIAKDNTRNILGYEIKDLHTIIKKMITDKFKDKYDNDDEDSIDSLVMEFLGDKKDVSPIPMYVLTNRYNLYGAACMVDENILSEFSDEISSDLIILPSSVHEVILVPENEVYDKKNLQSMVKEINDTQVADEEVLSDSVYIFQKDNKTLEVLCS